MSGLNARMLLVASSAVLLIGGVFAGAYIWTQGASPIVLKDRDASVVAAGKIIYTNNCAACHGANLEGQANWQDRNEQGKLPAPPHDRSGHTWHHGDKLLFELTKIGPKKILGDDYKTDMPVYEGILSDADIIAALSYIKSTWPEDIRKRHDLLNQSLRQQEAQK